jgi:hypothetical protein
MNTDQIVTHVLELLESIGIPYVLVGSLASNTYGIVRATQDADFVIQPSPGQFPLLLSSLGATYEADPQIQFETVTGTQKRFVREKSTGFVLEFFQLSQDPHDQARFARRQKLDVVGRDAWVLTAEDVLVTKLNWLNRANRAKDLLDIRAVISVQADNLDWPYIESWCDAHGSRPLLEKIRAELAVRRST